MSRIRTNFISGVLNDATLGASSGTTLNSAGLQNLPTISGGNVAVVAIDPQAVNGAPEIVYITAFTHGQTTATVLRAQEGTTQRAHFLNEFWIVTATAADFFLDQLNPPNSAVSMNSQKLTNLANATLSTDATAFGQLPTTLPPNGAAGGDLTGNYPNPTLSGTANVNTIIEAIRLDQMAHPTSAVSLNSQKISSLANGTLATDAAAFGQIPAALPPNGNAGGDLTGTYPNPTVTSTANFKTQVETVSLDLMAAAAADVNLNSHKITNLAAGVSSTDAANVSQVTAGQGAGNIVSTSQTTASTTYVDLATVGPTVTITTKTTCLVLLGANLANSTAGAYSIMSFAVSGATTLAASDANALSHQEFTGGTGAQNGTVVYLSGLTAGANTFTPKYRASGGTLTASNRTLAVIPLPT